MHISHKILTFFIAVGALAVLYVAGLYALPLLMMTPSYQPPNTGKPAATTNAPSVPIQNPFGTVTARSASSLTIKGPQGKSATFSIASETQILDESGAPAKSGTLVVGAIVSIQVDTQAAGATPTAKIIHIIPAPPPLPPAK